ncbi:MAG TPA: esterase-like activity of phytase family protein [Hyphomicrobium sp.]|nr:esterase-like activity of phytase family protein [Hyphomicrobium sp.]
MTLAHSTRAVLIALIFGLWHHAVLADAKPDIAKLKAGPITVDAAIIRNFARTEPAERALSSSKLTFRGGLILSSPSANFGGWSGLVVGDDAKTLLAISDSGAWMTGTIVYDGVHPVGIAEAHLGPLLARDGKPIGRERDSEAIALETGTLERGSVLVAFERRHRIKRYGLSSEGLSADRGTVPLPAAARRMRPNQGLEGMTVMRGGPHKGSVIAFSERLYDLSRNHTGWLWTRNGPATIHLKNIGDYDVTDLSSLDDGTLFVLERRFRWTEGVKMRLRRIAPGDVKPGRTMEGETLIEADLADQIDNMEGLSVTRLKTGEVLVTMISDDNFNHVLQRTMLLQFTVNGSGQAKARPQE